MFRCALIVLVSSGLSAVGMAQPTAPAPTAESASMNPATMAQLDGPSLFVRLSGFYTSDKSTITSDAGVTSTEESEVLFLPQLNYVYPINKKWSLGIGPSGASGIGTSYPDDWVGRYLVQEWSLLFVGLAPSVAYRINDSLALGASADVTYSRFALDKAVLNPDSLEADGNMKLEAGGLGVGGTLGLLVEISEGTSLGLAYSSKVIVSQKATPKFSDLTPLRRRALDTAGILDQEISFESTKPQTLLVSLDHEFPRRFSMSLDLLWIDFSEYGLGDVTIGTTSLMNEGPSFQDLWGALAGATFRLTPSWSVTSKIGYMTSPLKEEDRTALFRYTNILGVGAGIQHTFNGGHALAIDATYVKFGDGRFSVDNVVGGQVEGVYDSNSGVLLSVSYAR